MTAPVMIVQSYYSTRRSVGIEDLKTRPIQSNPIDVEGVSKKKICFIS